MDFISILSIFVHGLLRRLLCRLVGDAGAAHAADGGDQRDFVGHHRRRADRESAAAGGSASSKWLGLLAVVLASVNIFGGFAVTARMLAMYKKKERPAAK